jgi:hypothetical protein
MLVVKGRYTAGLGGGSRAVVGEDDRFSGRTFGEEGAVLNERG